MRNTVRNPEDQSSRAPGKGLALRVTPKHSTLPRFLSSRTKNPVPTTAEKLQDFCRRDQKSPNGRNFFKIPDCIMTKHKALMLGSHFFDASSTSEKYKIDERHLTQTIAAKIQPLPIIQLHWEVPLTLVSLSRAELLCTPWVRPSNSLNKPSTM